MDSLLTLNNAYSIENYLNKLILLKFTFKDDEKFVSSSTKFIISRASIRVTGPSTITVNCLLLNIFFKPSIHVQTWDFIPQSYALKWTVYVTNCLHNGRHYLICSSKFTIIVLF